MLYEVITDRYIADGDRAGLLRISTLYAGVLVAAFVVRFGQVYVLQMTGQKVMRDMRIV